MKHLQIYNNNVRGNENYQHHLQEAITTLNVSATYTRGAGIPSHQIERSAILKAMTEVFPDKTEEEIIIDLIHSPQIVPAAVNDFMYFHHQTFPGNKACLIPEFNLNKAKQIGLHIHNFFGSTPYSGSHFEVVNVKLAPQTIISYYDDNLEKWVLLQVADTDLYRVTKEFEETCISNGLPFQKGEFEKLMKYISAYKELNHRLIPSYDQYSFIGWNEDKTQFISPRRKDCYVRIADDKAQTMIKHGYVTKGNDAKQNLEQILEQLKDHPLSVAVYVSSYINVLMSGGFASSSYLILDIYGAKGKGKNLLQYTAMNPIGKSEEKSPLMQTWVGATDAGILASIRPHSSHPAFFDDSQTQTKETLQKAIYTAFNSAYGVKANKDGTAREDKNTTSIIISTGETSILSMVHMDGLTRRVLPLSIDRVLETLVDQPEKLKEWQDRLGKLLNSTYGLTLDLFVDYTLENKAAIEKRFEKYIALYRADSEHIMFDHERYNSYAKYLASMHVVLECLSEKYQLSSLNHEEINRICEYTNDYLKEICTGRNKNIEALEDVMAYATTNQKKHFTESNPNHSQYGKFSEYKVNDKIIPCLMIVTNELNNLLTTWGYVSKNVISSWATYGIIRTATSNKGGGRLSKVNSHKCSLTHADNTKTQPYCTFIHLEDAQNLIDQNN
ncbi:DUF927 domain-containing protein [Paenibacillus polymyxa]|uniref:DUF927 domain-containing protein n=1 Tax=Paenibacillus polymyxa TaxID=1406 RepID=UPI001BE77240|nr:DUF927 domain-containing protein [Paenibacillus polymyxa]MBT2284257.1 DUF927 domain-containing protein [Paenibacillus polymyxa]